MTTAPKDPAGVAELASLETSWLALLAEHSRDMRSVRRLAQRVIAARSRLFERNAELQGTRDADDPETAAEIDANILSIKRCTTLLNDMNLATGRASIPPEK